jgi:hypothetical protein
MLQALLISAPPSSHFIYIPVISTPGTLMGFLLGPTPTRDAFAPAARTAAAPEARKAERAARRASSPGADSP